MEWISVDADKIKVILSKEDMQTLAGSADGAPSDTHAFFKSVLETVRKQSGFDTRSSRPSVRIFSCPDGGCELYLTKKRDWMAFSDSPPKGRKVYRAEPRAAEGFLLASTPDFESLLALCLRLDGDGREARPTGRARAKLVEGKGRNGGRAARG